MLQTPVSTPELLHSLPVKACATTVPSSLQLSNLLQFLNVPDSFLESTTPPTKKSETQIGEMYIDSAISVLFFPISC